MELTVMRIMRVALAGAILLWIAGTLTVAHHSAAGQDFAKRVDLEGVVKVWEIANPHGRVVLHVSDAKGARDIEYETHSRNNMYRAGYRDGIVKAGDKVKISIAPNRDGSDGGYIASFLTAKGDKVGN
jgi:hypothetical protein